MKPAPTNYFMFFHNRKSPRMPNFDYSSANYYFVTICTQDKRCIFGAPNALNHWGAIAQDDMIALPTHYGSVHIDNFVIMPNHIHAIIILDEQSNTTLSNIVARYKAGVTRKINSGHTIWQRSFHDHVIRDQAGYEKIWNYIQYNPLKWEEDCFYTP